MTCSVVLVAAAAGRAELVSERWGGDDAPCTHAAALRVRTDGGRTTLAFDLSALPAGAAVHHASLACFTKDDLQPRTPVQVHAAGAAAPLALEAPWYRSLDATPAVRQWQAGREGALEFVVTSFGGLEPGRTCLEVRYDGRARDVPEQVTGLRAVHHHGQTFLVWRELADYRPPDGSVVWVSGFSRKRNELAKGPGPGWRGLPCVPAVTLKTLRELQGIELRDKPSGFQGIQAARRVRRVREVRYRVYRGERPITAANLHEARLVGEARPLAALDEKMAVISFRGEYIDQREVGESIIPIGCVTDAQPLSPGETFYAHTPRQAGRGYYAVTAMRDGTENARDITAACSLAEPVAERPEEPRPVLQRLQAVGGESKVVERWHLFWPAPPYANVPAPPLHVLVGEPEGAAGPLPMIVDGFHGGFNIVEALRVPSRTALTLLIEHQTPWGGDGDLLYSEGRGTLRSFQETKADYFSERYFLRMIAWARQAWAIDPARIVAGQHDSGPLHFAVRHPEIFARIFLGNYTASYVYGWSPPSNGLPALLGPKDLARTARGEPAWDVLDLGWYLRQDPARDIPLVMCSSGTGKDSGHTSEFGWQDDPRGLAALMAARQPFLAAWSTGGDDPGGHQRVRAVQDEVAAMFQKIRWDATIPAFARCSLDNNPGNGDPADGDSCGQINGWLLWDNADCVDAPGAWEMAVWLVAACPEGSCTVDITPRRCRAFRPRPGEVFRWTAGGQAGGTVTADKWGLVTVPRAVVTKARGRVRIERTSKGGSEQ